MTAYLQGVRGFVPERIVTNDDLVRSNPSWNSEQIFSKTGIRARHVASEHETSSDLGFRAADNLLTSLHVDRNHVDAILFCTQTPDYLLPASACVLQHRLGLSTSCAAFDINLGCSGFVYCLWLARSLIESKSAKSVLIIVGDTLSKVCNPNDLGTVALFGDAGAAALVTDDSTGAVASLGPAVLGTDGRGADHLIVRAGGARHPRSGAGCAAATEAPAIPSDERLSMNGPEIFSFTLSRVSVGIQQLLDRTELTWNDIDLFLFHQANAFMLHQLRKKMNIALEKLPLHLEQTGNTAAATIPLLIENCQQQGIIQPGFRTVLAGFGVGYSWGFSLLEWH